MAKLIGSRSPRSTHARYASFMSEGAVRFVVRCLRPRSISLRQPTLCLPVSGSIEKSIAEEM